MVEHRWIPSPAFERLIDSYRKNIVVFHPQNICRNRPKPFHHLFRFSTSEVRFFSSQYPFFRS